MSTTEKKGYLRNYWTRTEFYVFSIFKVNSLILMISISFGFDSTNSVRADQLNAPLDRKVNVTQVVKPLIDDFRMHQYTAIAKRVELPLKRMKPLSPIKDLEAMERSFNVIFENKFISEILNSDIDKDWSAIGDKGVMFKNGLLWLSYEGKITAVNYESKAERVASVILTESDKNSLHPSLQVFDKRIWEAKINNEHRVRLDKIDEGFRVSLWFKSNSKNQIPDVILNNGTITYDGSGGNHFYKFTNPISKTVYRIDVTVIGKEGGHELTIINDGKIVSRFNSYSSNMEN